jgi:hypothetical protein
MGVNMSKRKLKQYCKNNNYELWERPITPAGWKVWVADIYGLKYAQEHIHKKVAYANLWKFISETQKMAARKIV